MTIVVDLLCDAPADEGGKVISLAGEKRLSALKIPGAYLVLEDYIEVSLTAELLEERGVATETLRVANIAAFLVLKALAYEDRMEEKDAYDIIYCLTNYQEGPEAAAKAFVVLETRLPQDAMLARALDIFHRRFASDDATEGHRKDGPQSYARFLTDPSQPTRDLVSRRSAATAVETFLREVAKHKTEIPASES